jgi:hypothetical protein
MSEVINQLYASQHITPGHVICQSTELKRRPLVKICYIMLKSVIFNFPTSLADWQQS